MKEPGWQKTENFLAAQKSEAKFPVRSSPPLQAFFGKVMKPGIQKRVCPNTNTDIKKIA